MNLKKLERYLRVNLLGRGPRLIKKKLPGHGLTQVEKHCPRVNMVSVGSPPARMHSQPDGLRSVVKHSIYYIVMSNRFNGLKRYISY